MLRTEVSPGSWGAESCLGRAVTAVASSWARTKDSALVHVPGQREGGAVPEGGDPLPQLLASGPGQASEASSWWRTSAQRPAGTS